ncbi:tyrosine-type recombinase/integrase [bacterium]|nr:tyrosine-type recombinase/integrase [bacterium]
MPYAEFSILTGLRFGNLAGLRWPDIDWLSQLTHLWETKSDKQFSVELCDRAIALLRAQHDTWGDKSEWCWPNSKGGRLDSPHFRQRVWAPAFKRAGLVWHDPRHARKEGTASLGKSFDSRELFWSRPN